GIPVVTLPAATVRSTQPLGSVLAVHQAPDGKVLVDDGARRQVKLFDSTLTSATTTLDSASGAPNSYGRIIVGLTPFVGDSLLFADFTSRTLQVLDAHGQVARSVALPNPNDLASVARSPSWTDSHGRVAYTGFCKVQFGPREAGMLQNYSDSVPLVRADLD